MAEEADELRGTGEIKSLRAEMVHTRAEMAETINTLQTRLSPSRLVGDAKHAVANATVGRAKRLAATTRVELTNSGRGRWAAGAVVFAVAGLIARTLTRRWRTARRARTRFS
jgi:hypothetical protein